MGISPGDNGNVGQVGGGEAGGNSLAQKQQAKKCAAAYGSFDNHSGPRPGYTTKYLDSYGWSSAASGDVVQTVITPTHAAPNIMPRCNGGAWREDDAVTIRPGAGACPSSPTDLDSNTTYVFMAAYKSSEYLMGVLAHEFAHQWGADEDQADQVETAAIKAYKKDGGKKCK